MTEKMNKRVKTKWLKALRSGGYLQGKGQLCEIPYKQDEHGFITHPLTVDPERDYKFCCLGVLENLFCLEKNLTFDHGAMSSGMHSDQCTAWSGLDPDGGQDPNECATETLMQMNDGNGSYCKPRSFKQIANWIEHNL